MTMFKTGRWPANLIVSKSAVIEMDALASDNHIGMIYQANTAYNTDRIVEAKVRSMGDGHLESHIPRRSVVRWRSARRLVALIAVLALAGCGGDGSSPQLVDGSQAAELPCRARRAGRGCDDADERSWQLPAIDRETFRCLRVAAWDE